MELETCDRVLLVAATTGYQTRAFDEAAERAGIGLVRATDRCHVLDDPWQDSAIPIQFHAPTQAVEAILEALVSRPVAGVLAVGDRPVEIAAQVAERLDLPWHSPRGAAASRNKLTAREQWHTAGLPVPWYRIMPREVAPQDLANEIFCHVRSCVIKPVVLSGSRGVIRADSPAAFIAAADRVAKMLDAVDVRALRDTATGTLMVEEFIPGVEYALEGVLTEGRLNVLAIFDKPDPLDGPFFEETLYVTPAVLDEARHQAMTSAVATAAGALGLFHGPVHAECRINETGVFVLEVAARPIGGLCARSLRFTDRRDCLKPRTADDYDLGGEHDTVPLEELLLRHAAGQDVSHLERERAAAGVMMIPVPYKGVFRGVEGIDEAKQVPFVEDVQITATPDQMLIPLPEGASYLGFIFARGGGPRAVERALRAAHECLRFQVAPGVLFSASRQS